jgi:hypothetical protein
MLTLALQAVETTLKETPVTTSAIIAAAAAYVLQSTLGSVKAIRTRNVSNGNGGPVNGAGIKLDRCIAHETALATVQAEVASIHREIGEIKGITAAIFTKLDAKG